ncbi:hypothetical protein GOP47_0021478 [Adiantum capillus-veneris]|uniref:Uncharacterized protein n=1 Tax=Adiantum capillus-veneris TaxID=13818 RepID=A0A9D4U7H3_ADICA|nr:hypothetical protein GOP47_0021478 [Adiantum capillus-veneris]
MKKKMEAGLLQSAITVASGPKPRQIDEHQEVSKDTEGIPVFQVEEKHSAGVEMPCVNLPVEKSYQMSCDGESLWEEEELEAEAVVCRSDLSMQGVGQPRLDGHVEVQPMSVRLHAKRKVIPTLQVIR